MEFNAEYVVGFIDGEGCFQFKQYNRKSDGYDVIQTVATFYIGLSNKEYKFIKELRDYIGFGKIYNFKSMAVWRVSSQKDRLKLITLIDSTSGLKTLKKKDYADWKQKVLNRNWHNHIKKSSF